MVFLNIMHSHACMVDGGQISENPYRTSPLKSQGRILIPQNNFVVVVPRCLLGYFGHNLFCSVTFLIAWYISIVSFLLHPGWWKWTEEWWTCNIYIFRWRAAATSHHYNEIGIYGRSGAQITRPRFICKSW